MNGKNIAALAAITAVAAASVDQALVAEMEFLLQTGDWATLRNTWRSLNGVPPGNGFMDHPVATEKGDSLSARLSGLFQDARFQSEELEEAVGLLRSVAVMRVLHMSRINPDMLTRMMPPWTATLQHEMLFYFQNRISALVGLVERNELSPAEYSLARDTLFEKALALAFLGILNEPGQPGMYGAFGFPDPETATLDTILQMLEMTRAYSLEVIRDAESRLYAEHHRELVNACDGLVRDAQFLNRHREVLEILFEDLMGCMN